MPTNPVTAPDLPLGAHQSIAGGTPRAVERGLSAGCRVVQIFVKNNNRWVGKTTEEAEAREFRLAVARAGFLTPPPLPPRGVREGSPLASLGAGHDRRSRLAKRAAGRRV